MPEAQTHHHHHHHHHHSSGSEHRSSSSSASSSSAYRRPSSSDYSLRSFGKKGVDDAPLPEGALSGALFAAFITILVLGPIIIALLYRNKSLKDENFQLRTQLGAIMDQAGSEDLNLTTSRDRAAKPRYVSMDGEASPAKKSGRRVVPSVNSADALRTSLAEAPEDEDNGEEVEEAQEVVTRRVVEPAPVKIVSDEEIAKAVNMSMDEIATLKRDITLEPNGFRCQMDENGALTFVPDPFAQNLQGAFSSLSFGQDRDAASIFGMLSTAKPLWPYGLFYKAIAGKNKNEMARAKLLFSTVRALGCQTAESELYSALTALFMKEDSTASSTLLRIPAMMADRPALQIGPVFAPKSTSQETLNRIKAICGIQDIKEIDW